MVTATEHSELVEQAMTFLRESKNSIELYAAIPVDLNEYILPSAERSYELWIYSERYSPEFWLYGGQVIGHYQSAFELETI